MATKTVYMIYHYTGMYSMKRDVKDVTAPPAGRKSS